MNPMANELATKSATWRGLLERPDIQAQIAAAIRTEISPKTVARITLSNMLRNPRLMDCTQASVLQAVMTACALGLEPDGVSGQAYLVPYKDVCTLIPGYRGLIQLAYRSGEVLSIQALNVYANEKFERHVGAVPPIVHAPKPPDVRGAYIGSYAVATIKGGGCVAEFMWSAEVEAIRQRSKAKDSGPWVTDTDEMRRKTVVRRLFKYIPSSPTMRQAVAIEDEFESDRTTFVDMTDAPLPTTKVAKMIANVRAKTPLPEPPESPQDDSGGLDGHAEPEIVAPTPAATSSGLVIDSKMARELRNALLALDGEARMKLVTEYGLKAVALDAGLLMMTEDVADQLNADIGLALSGI
jgi:recombination protein RecT